MKSNTIGGCSVCFPRVLLLLVIITTSLLPINSAFVAADHNSDSRNTAAATARSRMALGLGTDTVSSEITNEFHQLVSVAVDLSNAHVSEAGILSIQRSVRDWENDKRKLYLYQFPIPLPYEILQQLPPMPMDPSIQIRLPSPSGKKLWIVKKGSDDNSKTELEFWENGALLRKLSIPKKQQQQQQQQQHGSILNDPTGFGIPSWSPDESSIVYVAERLPPTTHAFWETKKSSIDDGASSSLAGGQHVLGKGYMEEWGEQYVDQSPLLDLYILHFDSGRAARIANVPGDAKGSTIGGVTLGQPVWHRTLPKIAYTGWDAGGLGKMPKRLGMVYCRNRPSSIYWSDVTKLLQRLEGTTKAETDSSLLEATTEDKDTDFECLTSTFPYARSPQILETGEMIFLANPKEFVSHDGCMGLYKIIGKEGSRSSSMDCIVPVIDLPATDGPKVSDMGFPGLFLHQLPPACDCGSRHLILSTVWGSLSRLVRVDLETNRVQLIDFPSPMGGDKSSASSHFLQCQTPSGDWIVSETATNRPANLWLVPRAEIVKETNDDTVICENVKLLMKFPPIAASSFSPIQASNQIPFDVQIITVPEKDKSLPPVQAILTLPKQTDSEKVGLVVIPHGGPHSATISGYVPGFALLASQYAVVFPNYHGSTGFGQAALESLLTNIGDSDVKDVMRTTKYVISEWKDRIDETKIGICGGSHGGFLTSHCIGQYPDFFKAAVMRNPVTNIASMVTATDIPDWCHAEALGKYDFSKFRGPDIDELQTMYARSPIVHVSKVKTPTLIALGMKDLRVPPSQGTELFHILQSAGVETKLLVYPEDNHALNRVATEADHWIHIRQWFNQYLG